MFEVREEMTMKEFHDVWLEAKNAKDLLMDDRKNVLWDIGKVDPGTEACDELVKRLAQLESNIIEVKQDMSKASAGWFRQFDEDGRLAL